MLVYYINLLLIFGLAFPLCVFKPNKAKKAAYLAITFGYMWFLATFRYGIGFDYFNYANIFELIRATGSWQELAALDYEWGFLGLTKLMTFFIHDYTVMYGVYTALILLPIAWFIYRYCDDAWLSTWLYVTLAFFYTNMNFIRQSLACGLVVLGYKFLREKKPVPFLLVAVAAVLFHKTAIIAIPVYFLCHIRLNKRMGIFYAGATVLLYLTSGLILDVVTDYIFSYYKGTLFIEQGFPLYFLVVPVTLFGACLALTPVWSKRDPAAAMLMNLTMFSAIIWLFITRHFILERFSMYVYIFVLVAVPAALSCLKASPEEYAQLAEMEEAGGKKGKSTKSKEASAKQRELAQKISDHKKYYWSAVAGILLLTLIYNDFGANVNKFHGVFPYQSVLDWMNRLP